MRATRSLLATIVKNRNVLNVNTPTGLTGLLTHPSPRPHLIYLYNQTLTRLAALPEDSVYRQSTEALTRHRLAIVESTVPGDIPEWQSRITKIAQQHEDTPERKIARLMLQGKGYLPQVRDERDDRYIEWGDDVGEERGEGVRSGTDLRSNQATEFGAGMEAHQIVPRHHYVEDEPAWTVDQVSEVEHNIGSGLVEEVVRVAQNELNLVNEMRDAAVWEELEEKPPAGQWQYFQRDRHVGQTQSP